jgi:hypothetical protein
MGIGAREKRALVLAQNQAKAMLRKKTLSEKERKELHAIARMPIEVMLLEQRSAETPAG